MKSLAPSRFMRLRMVKQRGVVLFFALVALVAIMLAAVALIRSVDTSTIIAGNLAFKQAATASGDAGTEAAMNWLSVTQAANVAKNVLSDPTHTFNITDAARGYYSNTDPALNLFTDAVWDAIDKTIIPPTTDTSGNTIQYVIQRACRNANVAVAPLTAPPTPPHCLYIGAVQDTNGQSIPLPQDVCAGPGCPVAGQTTAIRVTSRVKGPRNTVSYVQAFVY